MSAADSYLPGHGDDRFGVEHYDLSLRYKPQGNHLEGRAVLRIIAGVELTNFVVDLYGLQVTSLRLEGAEVARWSHRAARLKVALRSATRAGARLTLTVAYRGSPGPMPGPDGLTGWEELTDGVLVAAQPHGAPTWFPCNDRMADKATYTIAVETDPAYRVVANGVLTEERRAGRRQRWVYEQYQPMATYLATLQIGRYVGEPQEGHPVPLWLVASPERMPRVRQAMADQPRMLEVFTQMFGPYPFDQYTSVVTDDPLEIPLESQTLSTFGSNHLSRGWPAQRLIAHELAHQWFGNAVTAASLADIWLHEGFACYAEWLWAQESGHSSTDAEAARNHAIMARRPQDLVLTAPGPEQVFDDRVYKRGALTLHAIRRTVGDDDFFDLLRTWVEAHCYEVVTTADFERTVEEVTGESHGALLDRWLRQQALPDLPGEEPPGLLQRAIPSVIRRIRG